MADEKFVTEQAFKDVLEKVYDLDVAGDGIKIDVDKVNKHKVISAPFDDVTVKNGANGFYVPIDNNTLVVENDVIKAKIDTEPGKGLVLDNGKISANVDNISLEVNADNKLAVRFDGYSIFENEDVQDHLLSGHYSTAGDGVDIEEHITDKGREQIISVKIDDDSIKLVDGKLTANNKVEDVTINGTSIVVDGEADISIASINQLGVVKFGNVDSGLSASSDGSISIVPATTVEIEARANVSNPITPSLIDSVVKDGLVNNSLTLTDDEKAKVQEWLDIQQAIDNVTIIRNPNKELTLPIDNETIQIKNGKLVSAGKVEAGDALTATVDSDHITTLDVNVDYMTVKVNDENKLETMVDGNYIVKGLSGITIPFDQDTFKLSGGKVKVDVETLSEFNTFWEGLI